MKRFAIADFLFIACRGAFASDAVASPLKMNPEGVGS